ncbi:Hpt domain-containing protein, partial [Oxalobacteraceae bacterium]|nr:Hpt domain-containing protein [Oxalobacteraceae bacterium]
APRDFALIGELDGLRQAYGKALPGRLDALRAALCAGRLDDAAGQVHMLKGSAGSFGLAEVSTLAVLVEAATLRGAVAEALEQLDRIDHLEAVRALRATGETYDTP